MMQCFGRIAAVGAVVVLVWGGSAEAATLTGPNGILAQLAAPNMNDTFVELGANARANFLSTTNPADININVLESTTGASFGVERGGVNSFLTVSRVTTTALSPANSGNGFQVYGTFDPLQPITLGQSLNRRQNTNNTDTAVTNRTDLAGDTIGTTGFRFIFQNGATLNGSAADTVGARNVTSFGNGTTLSSSGGFFRAFAITSGQDAGSYLVAFESPVNSIGAAGSFTFAALVSGVVNPEPASMAMLATGVLGLAGYRLRRRVKTTEPALAV